MIQDCPWQHLTYLKDHEQLDECQPATALSILDHYVARHTKLLQFVRQYTMPKSDPSRRKDVVVILHPYLFPEPNGPNYEQYCHQRLMMYKPVRQEQELLDTYGAAYVTFLQSDDVPPSLEDDIHSRISAEVCW